MSTEDLKPLDAGSGYGCPDCGDDLTPCPRCESSEDIREAAQDGVEAAKAHLSCLAKLSRLRQRVKAQEERHAQTQASWRKATGCTLPAQAQGLREQRDRAIAERDALRVELAAARKRIEEVRR